MAWGKNCEDTTITTSDTDSYYGEICHYIVCHIVV